MENRKTQRALRILHKVFEERLEQNENSRKLIERIVSDRLLPILNEARTLSALIQDPEAEQLLFKMAQSLDLAARIKSELQK